MSITPHISTDRYTQNAFFALVSDAAIRKEANIQKVLTHSLQLQLLIKLLDFFT